MHNIIQVVHEKKRNVGAGMINWGLRWKKVCSNKDAWLRVGVSLRIHGPCLRSWETRITCIINLTILNFHMSSFL